jgi:hypothetical protein
VARERAVQSRLSLADCVVARHVVVTVIAGKQPMIERWLQELSRSRTAAVRVAYFHAALTALPGTMLVATIPRRLAWGEPLVPPATLRVSPRNEVVMTGEGSIT